MVKVHLGVATDELYSDSQGLHRSLQAEKDRLYESCAAKQIGAGKYRSSADGIALQMQELSCKIEETELAFGRLTEDTTGRNRI